MIKNIVFSFLVISLSLLASCNAIKNLPTNTTGKLFSLNGTWKLTGTTDGDAMVGTTITVLPVIGNATIKSVQNNAWCARQNDQIWKKVKSNESGGFTISTLVNACNGTTFNDGVISVVNNDKITVTTRTATNTELIQAWNRITE